MTFTTKTRRPRVGLADLGWGLMTLAVILLFGLVEGM